MEHIVKTNHDNQMIDITDVVQEAVTSSGVTDGVVLVFVPHTSAAVTINENADPYVVEDLLYTLKKLVPKDPAYKHDEDNSDSHVKASLFGQSAYVIIEKGKLKLGTWQSIFFCEFDGPRTRKFYTKILK